MLASVRSVSGSAVAFTYTAQDYVDCTIPVFIFISRFPCSIRHKSWTLTKGAGFDDILHCITVCFDLTALSIP